MMVNHILKRMEEIIGRATLSDVGDVANEYFRLNRMDPEKEELPSMVFLCSWNLHKEKYEVLVVGDWSEEAEFVEVNVFGWGSGSDPGLNGLRDLFSLGAPIDMNTLARIMMTAAGIDPHTGGVVRVFSLRPGICDAVYRGKLIDELYGHNPEYEDMLYDGKSMFVIIPRIHESILNPLDLVEHKEVCV